MVINREGGVKPRYKKVRTTFDLLCGLPENRPKDNQKPPKTARKTTETGMKFYKKRAGWGSKAFYKNYKKTDIFIQDEVT